MDHIGNLFKLPPEKPRRIGGQRALIIEQFCDELDKGVGNSYLDPKTKKWKKQKPVNRQHIAIKLSHVKPNQALWDFLSQCRQSKSGFAKCFYGALKVMHRPWDKKN